MKTKTKRKQPYYALQAWSQWLD